MKKSFILCMLLLALLAFPVLFVPANAAGTGKSVQLVNQYNPTGGIRDGDHLYYGKDTEDTNNFNACWRVLDADHTNAGDEGMFLLTDRLVGDLNSHDGGVCFDKDGASNDGESSSNDWKVSDAREWCSRFLSESISSREQKALIRTRKSDGSFSYSGKGYYASFLSSDSILNGDRIFFLSAEEAVNSQYNLDSSQTKIGSFQGRESWWWLRSALSGESARLSAGAVNRDGELDYRNVKEESPARPACNLDWSSVLFASNTWWKKPVGTAGPEGLTEPEGLKGTLWKLTIRDDRHQSFGVSRVSCSGNLVIISYTGAVTGENEYISGIITDESGEINWYGVFKKADLEDGQVRIDVSGKYSQGDTLYVFNEQINEDRKTDYAGSLQEIIMKEDVSVPEAKAGLAYTGKVMTGVIPGLNYTLKGNTAVEAGNYTATAALTDPDHYQWEDGTTDPKSIKWTISQASMGIVTISNVGAKTYTGSAVIQNPVVKLNGRQLTLGKDYTISYANNKAPGIATMYIYGKGSLKGVRTVTFRIEEKKTTVKKDTAVKKDTDIIGEMNADGAPSIGSFGPLQLKAGSKKAGTVTLQWKKVAGARQYIVFGNKCGGENEVKKIRALTGKKLTIKKIKGKKLKKGTYYKFLVAALDKKGKIITISQTVHIVTKGGRYGNDKKVVTAAGSKITIKKGNGFKLSARTVPQSTKYPVKKHRDIRYETTNHAVAKVSGKGIIIGKKAGKCTVYAYAQNGVCAKVAVVVR